MGGQGRSGPVHSRSKHCQNFLLFLPRLLLENDRDTFWGLGCSHYDFVWSLDGAVTECLCLAAPANTPGECGPVVLSWELRGTCSRPGALKGPRRLWWEGGPSVFKAVLGRAGLGWPLNGNANRPFSPSILTEGSAGPVTVWTRVLFCHNPVGKLRQANPQTPENQISSLN